MGQSLSSHVDIDDEREARRRQRRAIDKRNARQIDDDRIVVDSASLQCPICYEIFPTCAHRMLYRNSTSFTYSFCSAPILLDCGHSFCQHCIDRLFKQPTAGNVRQVEDGYRCKYLVVSN